MSDQIDVQYWKEVEDFTVRQLAMLLVGENPPKEIHGNYDNELSPVAKVMLDALILQIESGEIKTLNYAETMWEVEVDGEFYTRFETNFEDIRISREEFAVFAHKREISPPFLEHELKNIDEIIERRSIEKSLEDKIREELAAIFLKATDEFNQLRASCSQYKDISEKADCALELLRNNPSKFNYITEEHVSVDWFDPNRGLREAQKAVYPSLARKRGISITHHAAQKLYEAKKEGKELPPVKIKKCIPDD